MSSPSYKMYTSLLAHDAGYRKVHGVLSRLCTRGKTPALKVPESVRAGELLVLVLRVRRINRKVRKRLQGQVLSGHHVHEIIATYSRHQQRLKNILTCAIYESDSSSQSVPGKPILAQCTVVLLLAVAHDCSVEKKSR